MRMTPQRRAIFEVLSENRLHPTAEDVFLAVRRRHRGLSLATVYNTLETLHRLGELGRHEMGTGAERFDPETKPHHHFVCERCGEVEDVFGELPVDRLIPPGFTLGRAELKLTGLCPRCSQAGAKQRTARSAVRRSPKTS
ncbi:MAG: Fur family transcriptional regulator [Deltaproteobacteria bacterium]